MVVGFQRHLSSEVRHSYYFEGALFCTNFSRCFSVLFCVSCPLVLGMLCAGPGIPITDYKPLMEELDRMRGPTGVRVKLLKEVIDESLRFKRRNLASCLDKRLKRLMEEVSLLPGTNGSRWTRPTIRASTSGTPYKLNLIDRLVSLYIVYIFVNIMLYMKSCLYYLLLF